MGVFRVEIEAVGDHGCQRNVKDGGTVVTACGHPGCVDCLVRGFVRQLEAAGVNFGNGGHAELLHWPSTAAEVVDDLLTGRRTGSF